MNYIFWTAHPYAVLIFGFGLGMFCHFVLTALSARACRRYLAAPQRDSRS